MTVTVENSVACVNTKRHFIGIEMDGNYFQIGKDRILDKQIPVNIQEDDL